MGVLARGPRPRRGRARGGGRRAGARHRGHAVRLRGLALCQGQEGAVRYDGVNTRLVLQFFFDELNYGFFLGFSVVFGVIVKLTIDLSNYMNG